MMWLQVAVGLLLVSCGSSRAQEFDDLLTDDINERDLETQEFWDAGWKPELEGASNWTQRSAGCVIDINNAGQSNPPPLLIHPNSERLVHPTTRNGLVQLAANQRIELFCSAAFESPAIHGAGQLQVAQCVGGTQFLVNGRIVSIGSVRCSAYARHVDRRFPTRRCPNAAAATEVQLGFRLTDNRFLRLMDVCHDELRHSTLYVRHELAPATAGFQRSFPRPGFIKGTFFGPLNVNQLYTGVVQRETIGRVLGAQRVAQLFDNSRNFFLARGHLAAKTDYIYGTEQRGTFFFVNAAPQWQSFNAGNWERIEFGVKNFVAAQKLQAQLYTGTFGVLRMADGGGVERELFLHYDAQGRGEIPVPMFFYKVVLDVRSRRGIVFVGLNNPHATAAEVASGKYTLCRDVSGRVTYVPWQRTNLARGFSYACEVNEFVRVVRHLPAGISASGLLV